MTTMKELKQRRRRRRTGILLAGVAGALCLQGLTLTLPDASDADPPDSRAASVTNDLDDDADESSLWDWIEGEHGRSLTASLDQDNAVDEIDYDAATAAAFAAVDGDHAEELPELQPYTLEDALSESEAFEYTFAVVVFDPKEDQFFALYNKRHKWKAGNKKLWKSMRYLTYMLRRTFPRRFTRQSDELVFAIGSGDYPHVKPGIFPHEGVAPVLMFGSSFRDPNLYANMMAMPMPEDHHLFCFEEYMTKRQTCKEMRAKVPGAKKDDDGHLVFGEEYGLEWDDLTPQLIWRGTDFGYLPTFPRPSMVRAQASNYVPTGEDDSSKRAGAIHALMAAYDTLLPRWKAAALAAEAELEAQQGHGQIPWADIKFSAYLEKGKSATVGSKWYSQWESLGIGVDHGKSLTDLAGYKYHIDLGGGGGTTWSGTVEKLAMPGLLFHHVTPTKDYIHDRMRPWKHYVPVASDLKDLRSKFDWAEDHPVEAKRIADAGTAFMRELGTPEGFGRMFEEDFVEPMRRVIEAYRPVADAHPEGTSWLDVLHSTKDCMVLPVMKCSGKKVKKSCELVGGDDVMKWQKVGGWYDGSNRGRPRS